MVLSCALGRPVSRLLGQLGLLTKRIRRLDRANFSVRMDRANEANSWAT
jgi:hypothetical protein